ncbi:MAG: M81 family metallopeptidase, partial [Dysgonamonadaceae bacterium]|nr:M81 family metallopeptidase [Dysgonamonadaceae bacterium]
MKRVIINSVTFFCVMIFLVSCFSKSNSKTKRVLTLGIRHESNTFSTLPTRATDFKVLRGEDVLVDQPWAEEGRRLGIEFIPTVHAYSWPGGVVEKTIFESL